LQPLYPISVLEPADASLGYNTILQGCMVVIPFTLNENGAIIMKAVHAALTEDYSIKCWFSLLPNGSPINYEPPTNATFSLLRLPFEIVVYDPATEPPGTLNGEEVMQILNPLPPGQLYFNLLNLINKQNIFTFSMTVID
jgi:hypothetical protein